MEWWGAHWHEVVDVVSAVFTVVAAGLAGWAIRRGNKQAKDSADALVRERRIDFELDQLDRLHSAVTSYTPFTGPTAKHLQILPDAFPLLRAVMGEPSTQEAQTEIRALREAHPNHGFINQEPLSTGQLLIEAIRGEVEGAIQKRLDERG